MKKESFSVFVHSSQDYICEYVLTHKTIVSLLIMSSTLSNEFLSLSAKRERTSPARGVLCHQQTWLF